jgi:NTP pyrophosphatase (non-canonical NTP hydrolase)
MRATVTPPLLVSLDTITHEATSMLGVLDRERKNIPNDDRREATRRILKLRAEAQELCDWISEAWGQEKN